MEKKSNNTFNQDYITYNLYMDYYLGRGKSSYNMFEIDKLQLEFAKKEKTREAFLYSQTTERVVENYFYEFPYPIIFIDAEKYDKLLKQLPKLNFIQFIPLHINEEKGSTIIQRIKEIMHTYSYGPDRTLLISENEYLLFTAQNELKIDTCHITSTNSKIDFTYQVPSVESVKSLKLKKDLFRK